MSPAVLKSGTSSEREIQKTIIAGIRQAHPEAIVHHSPNAARHPQHRFSMARDGVVAGFPDLTVLLGGGVVLFLEVKSARGVLSPKQRAFQEAAKALGHRCAVVRSLKDALDAIHLANGNCERLAAGG